MNGHLNRKQFNRCVWSAAMMLVGSAAACLVDSGLKSILPNGNGRTPIFIHALGSECVLGDIE